MNNDKKISIIFIIPSLSGGGAEKVICTIARELNKEKFDISVALVTTRNAVHRDLLPDYIKIIDLKSTRVLFSLPKIVFLLWKKKPNILFSSVGHLNLAISLIMAILPKSTKYIARETGTVSKIIYDLKFSTLWTLGYKLFYPKYDLIICQSQYMKDDLSKNFLIAPKKMIVINNPIDVDNILELALESTPEIAYRRNNINLVSVGRLSHEKGYDILLNTISLIHNHDIHLNILGDGPMKKQLEKQSIDLGISEKVSFLGYVKNPYPYIKLADALIMCSRHEAFSNVVLEALTCGTPVIATPSPGGIHEVLDNINECHIVKEISAEALADCIINHNFKNRVDKNAISPYLVKKIIHKYEEEIVKNVLI